MEEKEIINRTDEDESLSALYRHAGWKHMVDYINKKEKSLKNKLYTVDPEDSTEIAAIQAKLKVLRNIKKRPKRFFQKKVNRK